MGCSPLYQLLDEDRAELSELARIYSWLVMKRNHAERLEREGKILPDSESSEAYALRKKINAHEGKFLIERIRTTRIKIALLEAQEAGEPDPVMIDGQEELF